MCVKMCVHLSGCLYVRYKEKGTSGWILFYWQYHSFINTWVLFLCSGNLRG